MPTTASPPAKGFTLIEVLVVIVVIGIASVTLTKLALQGSTMSAQSLRQQQARALATALLSEARAKPFTYCDPNLDPNPSATSALSCTTPEVMGPEGSQSRSGAVPFNHVSDYNALSLSGASLTDATGAPMAANLPQVASCTATFAVRPVAFMAITVASGDALLISVSVSCPGLQAPETAQGLAVRYAPVQYAY